MRIIRAKLISCFTASLFTGVLPSLLLSVPLLIWSSISAAANIEDIRMWRGPDHTRLVFDLDQAVEFTVFSLDNPPRIVIDIEDSILLDGFDSLQLAGSPISNIRSAINDDKTLRVVLDINSQVHPKSFTLPANADSSDRLVVDLFDELIAATQPVIASAVAEISSPDSQQKRDIVVAIVAGHGGEDPGGIGYDGKLQEKNITLSLSRAIFRQLDAMPGYKPVLVRDGDYYIQLEQRPQIARENRADLLVSIHTDWYRTAEARGVTIYALSGDRADRENARRVAEKENGADLIGGVDGNLSLRDRDDDLALTLLDLSMSWSMEQSVLAGSHILSSLDGVARLRKNKVQQASLLVLRSPDIPSLLIETGYLTNPQEARKLASPRYQRQLSVSIAQGVMNYFNDAPPIDSLIAWQQRNGIYPSSYTVIRDDSLSQIAQRFGLSLAQLKAINSLNSNTIQIGQTLLTSSSGVIPLTGGLSNDISTNSVDEHKISRDETLLGIALRYNTTLTKLRRANNLSNDLIRVGQVLKIPNR